MSFSAGNKLRIAQVAPLWTPIPPSTYGGIELLLALLCDGLVARGHDVALFASGDCRTSAKVRAVIPVNLGELMSRGDALMYEYYMNAAMASVLAAQDEFDIVHCHLPPAWLPFAAAMRTPCTFTLHTSPHTDDEWALRNSPRANAVAISSAQVAAASSLLGRKFPVVSQNSCYRFGVNSDSVCLAFFSANCKTVFQSDNQCQPDKRTGR